MYCISKFVALIASRIDLTILKGNLVTSIKVTMQLDFDPTAPFLGKYPADKLTHTQSFSIVCSSKR